MKRFLTLLMTLTLFTMLSAQPTIVRDDLIAPGDGYLTATVNPMPDPGADGAQVTWDFSGVSPSSPVTYTVEDASGTPYAGTFPQANIAVMQAGGGLYEYHALTTDAWEEQGYVTEGYSTLTYDNPRTYLQFPLTYQDSWQDDYTYTLTYTTNPPIVTLGEGTLDVQVDGYGTVVLPQATFTDALRLRILGTSTDTSELGSGLYERNYYHDTTYLWLSPSYHAPLCSYTSSALLRYTTLTIGDTMVFEERDSFQLFQVDPNAQPEVSAVRIPQHDFFAMTVTPNPFSDVIEMQCQSDKVQSLDFEVRDLNGRRCMHTSVLVTPGDNRVRIPVPELPGGMYLALLTSTEGISVQKILHVTPGG